MVLDPALAAGLAASLDSGVDWSPEVFPLGGIHWYAGERTDNKKRPHLAPINSLAAEALAAARPDILRPGWIFPSPKDPSRAIGHYAARRWMRRAEKHAGIESLKGGKWHPFRRGWATARKHLPAADTAKAGGWRDTATMQECYIGEDGRTILAAVNG